MPATRKTNAVETSTLQPFVITRVFDAPRSLVWKAWAERDRLMQWFGPKGFIMRVATLDLRPGGIFHYCLRSPDGKDMWGKFVYRELVRRSARGDGRPTAADVPDWNRRAA